MLSWLAGDLHKLLDPDMELSFGEELAATDSAAKRAASNMHATLVTSTCLMSASANVTRWYILFKVWCGSGCS